MGQQAVAVELFSTSILSNHKVRSRHERYVSILQVKGIPFVYHDLASDEDAKSTWRAKALDKQIPGLLVHGEWRGTFEEFEEAIEFGELDLFLRIDQERAKREAADGTIPQPATAPVQSESSTQNGSLAPPASEPTPRKPSKHVVRTVTPLAQPRQPSQNSLAPSLPMAAPGTVRRKKDDAEGFLRSLGIDDLNLTEEELNDLMQAGQASNDKRTTSAEQRNDGKYPESLGIGSSSTKQAVPRTYIPSAEAGVKPLRLAKMGDGSSRSASMASPHARYNASQTSSRALAAEAQASMSSRSFSAVKLREAVSQGGDLKSAMSQTRSASNTDAAEQVVGREDIDDLLNSLGLDDVKMTDEEAEAFLFSGTIPTGLGAGGERVRRSLTSAERARNETAARDVAKRARERGYGSGSSAGSQHSRTSSAASATKEDALAKDSNTEEEQVVGDQSIIIKSGDDAEEADDEFETSGDAEVGTADTIIAKNRDSTQQSSDANAVSSDTIMAKRTISSPPEAPAELPESIEQASAIQAEPESLPLTTLSEDQNAQTTSNEVTPSASKTSIEPQSVEKEGKHQVEDHESAEDPSSNLEAATSVKVDAHGESTVPEAVSHSASEQSGEKELKAKEDGNEDAIVPESKDAIDTKPVQDGSLLSETEKNDHIQPHKTPATVQDLEEKVQAVTLDDDSVDVTHETRDRTPRQSYINLPDETKINEQAATGQQASEPTVSSTSPATSPAKGPASPPPPAPPSPKNALRYSQLQLDSSFAALASQISSGKRELLPEVKDEEEPDRGPVIMARKASLSPSASVQVSPSVQRRSLASTSETSTSSLSPQKSPSVLNDQHSASPQGSSVRSPSTSSFSTGSRSTNRRKAIDVQRPIVSSPTSDLSFSPPPSNALGMLRMPSTGKNGRSTSQTRSSSSNSENLLSISPETAKNTGKSPKSPAMKLFSIGKRKTSKKGRRSSSNNGDEEDEEEEISTIDTRPLGGGNDRSQKTLSVILREADEAMAGLDGDDDDGLGLDGDDDDVGAFDFDIDLDADDGIEFER